MQVDSSRKSYINLIKELAISDFKLRYQGSALGYIWTVLKPLMFFGILYVIFSVFVKFEIEYYSVYLLLGIILWAYLEEGTSLSMSNLVNKGSLISRIYFPRSIIIIASTLTSFLTLLFNLIILAVFIVIAGVPLSPTIFVFILFLLELYFIVLGIGLLVSALNIRFRDLTQVWEVLLKLGFWATPIIYSIDLIPSKFHFWIFLNPMTRILHYSREVLIYGRMPDMAGIWGSVLLTAVIFAIGLLVFKKREPYFAEEL